MKACKRCAVVKDLCAFRPDPRYRDGYGSWCMSCHRERGAEWAKENRARLSKKAAARRAENPMIAIAADRKWKSANKGKTSQRYREWRIANKAYDSARAAARKAAKLRATPLWADADAMSAFYRNRPAGHDVDHIVPLVSSRVCGLHCEANLQYLPSAENQAKRNFYWPDMPEAAQRQGRLIA